MFFQIIFPFRLLQNIEQSSLCYTVDPSIFIYTQCYPFPLHIVYKLSYRKNTCTWASHDVFLLHPRLYPIIYSPGRMQPQIPMCLRSHPPPPTSSWFPKGPLCTAEGRPNYISTPQQCLLALQPQVEQLKLVASWVICLGKMPLCVCVGGGGVGMCVLVTQLCLTLCNTMYYSPPASSVHGIIHARKLEWVAMPSSRRSS